MIINGTAIETDSPVYPVIDIPLPGAGNVTNVVLDASDDVICKVTGDDEADPGVNGAVIVEFNGQNITFDTPTTFKFSQGFAMLGWKEMSELKGFINTVSKVLFPFVNAAKVIANIF